MFLCMFMAEITKRHNEHSNLIKEIHTSTAFALGNQQASIKALEIQVRQISIILHEKLFRDLRSLTEIMPNANDETISTFLKIDMPSICRIDASQYAVSNLQNKNLFLESNKKVGPSLNHLSEDYWDELKETNGEIGDLIPTKLIVELADKTIKRPKGIAENVLADIDKFTFPSDFIILDILEDFKTSLVLGRPFLSTAHAIINVFKAKITLSVRNDKIFIKSNKPTSNIIKRVYALSLIRSTELDLEARLIGNTLRKNRSHDPKLEDFIELNDLNKPFELSHDQVVDLGPTTKEGEGIDTPIKEMVKTRHEDDMITNEIEDYPSFSDLYRKIHVNSAYNFRISCMIGYEHVDANFFPLLSLNMMSKRFYNSIRKDKLEFTREII
nr:hypothetical protein [Tanacetum cinerariifolium]